MGKRHEPVFVQAFVAEFTVEAFGVAVLRRFSGGDIMPFDTVVVRPLQDCPTGQFRTVIADDAMGPAIASDKFVELPHDSFAAERSIHDQGQAFTCALIHDAQNAEPASIR